MKPLIFKLKCELYPHRIIFYIGEKPLDCVVADICVRHGLWNGEGRVPSAGHGDAGVQPFSGGCFVWLPPYDKKNQALWIATMVHEMCHVLTNISEQVGCYMDKNTEEFHAYYAGWVTEQLMKRVLK